MKHFLYLRYVFVSMFMLLSMGFSRVWAEDLVFNDPDFMPRGNTPYFFVPEEDGILKWEIPSGSTYVTGGLFDTYGAWIEPTSTDGSFEWTNTYRCSWCEYKLEAGNEYYFQWTKNVNYLDYSLLVSWTPAAQEDVDPNPVNIYQIICNYTNNGNSWYTDNAGGAYVQFDGGQLRIKNLCAADWMAGEIINGENKAVFKTGEIGDGTYFNAYYIEGNQQKELDEFYMEFSDDRKTITLCPYEGHDVIIGVRYASGYWSVRWKSVGLYLFPDQPSAPPADSESYMFDMSFMDRYDTLSSQIVEAFEKDKEIWIKDMVYKDAYFKGTILDNGNLLLRTPQFQGVVAHYLSYAYARKDGDICTEFELVSQEDGSYRLEEGVEIWKGELTAEYMALKEVVMRPISSYDGAPKAPMDVKWDSYNDHVINFVLPMEGENGDELVRKWTYWQVLVDNEPYRFTYPVYGDYNLLILGEPYYLDASQILYAPDKETGEYIKWGNIGENNFKAYLPEFTSSDNITIRCGYQRAEGEIHWSQAVSPEIGEIVVDPLPEEGIYTTSVTRDTPYGGYSESGLAMYARFEGDDVDVSGFFGKKGWIVGRFTDERKRKASFISPQIIGTDDDSEVELYAATLSGTSTADQLVFNKINNFELKVGRGGNSISVSDRDIYFLEVTNGEITNVWYSDLVMQLLQDKAPEIPEDAVASDYVMEYRDIWEQPATAIIKIYRNESNQIWIDGMVRDQEETAVLAGSEENGYIVIDFPQFVGVMRNKIAYATCHPWDFDEDQLIFEPTGDGGFHCGGEIWIGPSMYTYDLWRPVVDISLTPLIPDVVDIIQWGKGVDFSNGKFSSRGNEEITVYSASGMVIPNENLAPGIYIVKHGNKTEKVCVK